LAAKFNVLLDGEVAEPLAPPMPVVILDALLAVAFDCCHIILVLNFVIVPSFIRYKKRGIPSGNVSRCYEKRGALFALLFDFLFDSSALQLWVVEYAIQ
jgi:hypothetical protein